MAIPNTKEELTIEIETTYNKLLNELQQIPDELTKNKTLDGHVKSTSMSISDLVAYLIGWGELVLKWNNKTTLGQHVDFPETGYKWNELGKLATKFYEDYQKLDYPELLAKLDNTVKKIQHLINQSTDEELYHKAFYNQWSKGRLIQLNTSSPFKNARIRIRKWKKKEAV